MVEWRMRWMWIESVYVLHIDPGTGVVDFSKGVGRVARTYRIDVFTHMDWETY